MRVSIRTDRLRIDPLAEPDCDALHAHWADSEVRRFLWDGRSPERSEVLEIIRRNDGAFEGEGAGLWSLRSTDDSFVGCAGFWPFHEPPELELIVSLAPSAWGAGLATEAAAGLLDHVFGELGWRTVQASTDAPNERSLRLIRRLGMRPTGQRPGAFGTIEVFRIRADEWTTAEGRGAAGRGRQLAPDPLPE